MFSHKSLSPCELRPGFAKPFVPANEDTVTSALLENAHLSVTISNVPQLVLRDLLE